MSSRKEKWFLTTKVENSENGMAIWNIVNWEKRQEFDNLLIR